MNKIPKQNPNYKNIHHTKETSSFPCLVKYKYKKFREDMEGYPTEEAIEFIAYKVDYFGNDEGEYSEGYWINKNENEEYIDFVEGIFDL